MGTWNIKPFGNDTALDWLFGLEENKDGSEYISKTIDTVLENYCGGVSKAEEAMAAISIIAAAVENPIKGINKDAKSWINFSGYVPSRELIDKAIEALRVITKNSELFELWEESDSFKSWKKNTTKLAAILADSKSINLPLRKPKKRSVPRSLFKLVAYYEKYPDDKVKEKIVEKIKAIDDVNVGSKETDYILPLSLLTKHGLKNEVNYLLENGANPNLKSDFELPPLTLACIHGHLEIASLLIEFDANIFGETTMDVNTGFRYQPELYEDKSEKPELKIFKYCTALFSVASQGAPSAIDFLISHGADIYQLDLNGETLLHKASYHGNLATLKYLIRLGVDVNKTKGTISGNKNSNGESALHYAVQRGNYEAIVMLLENGADPNIVEYFHGEKNNWETTPLDIVNDQPNSKIYKILVQHGAKFAQELDN